LAFKFHKVLKLMLWHQTQTLSGLEGCVQLYRVLDCLYQRLEQEDSPISIDRFWSSALGLLRGECEEGEGERQWKEVLARLREWRMVERLALIKRRPELVR
jgi:hypothetical protein